MNLSKNFSLKKVFLQGFFALVFFSPLLVLTLFPSESIELDSTLFLEAIINTGLLSLFVLLFSGFFGIGFSFLHLFYDYPLKRFLHLMMLLPLAFPPYVIAFIYLGALAPGSDFFQWSSLQIQGELWFLVLVLGFSLNPYFYFFSSLGLERLDQNLREAGQILGVSPWAFFKTGLAPLLKPYVLSASILVLFESLADFGAASVVNVPVITTMIYKLWFDLFSFPGAVHLCLQYCLVILFVLFIEFLIRKKGGEQKESRVGQKIKATDPGVFLKWSITILSLVYVSLSFLFPVFQLILWSLTEQSWPEIILPLKHTLFLAAGAAGLAVLISFLLGPGLRVCGWGLKSYLLPLTSFGYGLPGTILAVSAYSLLLFFFDEIGHGYLLFALVIALCYKFLTISLRSIIERMEALPKNLDEVSDVLSVGFFKRLTDCFFPEMKSALVLGFLLVMIEVAKEMPLTLMLAPSQYQTLSIQIFNLTSEGQWDQAAVPGLLLVMVGLFSVFLIHRHRLVP